MPRTRELRPGQLRRTLDPSRLRVGSTAEITPLAGTVGQPRALEAIVYALGVPASGHHLFVAGAPGSGRKSTVLDFLAEEAKKRPAPDDWVYVHSFGAPDRPDAMRLPAGRGAQLAADMDEFVRAARTAIARAFEGESYEQREHEIVTDVGKRREALTHELRSFAAERSFALEVAPVGVVTAPLVGGKPLTPERFSTLDDVQRAALERSQHEIEERTSAFARQMHQLAKEATDRMRELERDVGAFAIDPLFRDLSERYADVEEVDRYLVAIRADVLAHISEFRAAGEPDASAPLPEGFARYQVNVFVDNTAAVGAPVLVESGPQYRNLIGRVTYRPTLGAMVTDFREVKAGSLHRANGGFLVLEALDVLRHPFAWDALKRALRSREVVIENLTEEFSAVPTSLLRPEPIPLTVKVVMIGSRLVYRLLYELDEDFRELFRVKADFAPDMDWSAENNRAYAAFLSRWVHDNGLRHIDATGIARLIEHGARLTGRRRKLSARLIEIADVATEASHVAERSSRELVSADDVREALSRRRYRFGLVEERLQELIDDGTLVIETAGTRVGVVNGLSVLDVGDYAFGRPARVSARVSLGRGGIASIERETDLSGPIHSKGFLTLVGFLTGTYAQEYPLALSATLAFEQSYDEVEGDSASSTELYALLSALSGLALRQDIAVTGSVDQHGHVQAVGGVNEKIEGFFAVCSARGLTGTQGVAIPAANVESLMLDEDVADAVQRGLFHVWPVRTVDEGLELLTGVVAGRRRGDGTFPPATVHGRVDARLRGYVDVLRASGYTDEDGVVAGDVPARSGRTRGAPRRQ